MFTCKNRSVRSLLAAAGLVASVQAFTQGAQAQINSPATTDPSASASTADTINRAADLMAAGKPTQARTALVPLTEPGRSATLSDAERARVFTILANANARLKSMSALDVSL